MSEHIMCSKYGEDVEWSGDVVEVPYNLLDTGLECGIITVEEQEDRTPYVARDWDAWYTILDEVENVVI